MERKREENLTKILLLNNLTDINASDVLNKSITNIFKDLMTEPNNTDPIIETEVIEYLEQITQRMHKIDKTIIKIET
jgi:hypothetical protein